MRKRNLFQWTLRGKPYYLLAAGITAALTLFLLGYVLVKGLPNISWELLSTKPSYLRGKPYFLLAAGSLAILLTIIGVML